MDILALNQTKYMNLINMLKYFYGPESQEKAAYMFAFILILLFCLYLLCYFDIDG